MLSTALRIVPVTLRPVLRAMLVAWTVLLGLGVEAAHAQTTGFLEGTVEDEDGIEIPGVEVVISAPELIGGEQSQLTDEQGRYRFVKLLPGLYTIRAVHPEFRPQTISGVQILISRTVTQNIVLKAGQTEEIVVESGQAIDTSSATVGKVLTKDFLQRIPTGRSYQEAVQLTAGVSGGSNPNMAGGASNENTYLLDGAEVTDPVTGTFSLNFNFDAIQQIEVLLGGYDAEYGVSLGGIINIVTESGTNNLEFDTGAYYLNGNLRPREDARISSDGYRLAPSAFDQFTDSVQVSARVSGPMIQDKAWFILSYQYSRSVANLAGSPQLQDYESHYVLAKLTVQPNSSHRISILGSGDPTTIDNVVQGDPFVKPDAQYAQNQGGFLVQGLWQWFIDQKMNLETRAQVQRSWIDFGAVPCTHDRDRNWKSCAPGDIEGDVDYYTPGRVGSNGAFDSINAQQFVFDDRWRGQGSIKYSLLGIEDKAGGRHDLKIGVETNQTLRDSLQGAHGSRFFQDFNFSFSDPESYGNIYVYETTGPFRSRGTTSTFSAYVQDAYKPVSNLTIRFGLRYDNTVLRNDIGDPVIRGNLFGPRLFAAWDPWGDQKTKIAGGYGRFNETGRQELAGFTNVGQFGNKIYLGSYFGAQGDGVGHLLSQGQLQFFFPRRNYARTYQNLQLPSVDEFNVVLERQLVTDLVFGVTFQGRFIRHLYAPDEVNLVYDEDGSAPIGARQGDYLNYYLRLRTPRESLRNYYRVDFSLTKRQARRWYASATYSYTFTNGTQGQSLDGSFQVDPQTQYIYGPLLTNITHAVNGAVFWDVAGTDPWTFTLGASIDYESGQPLERLYWSDNNLAGSARNYRLRVRQRGVYWFFNDSWNLNLRMRQRINVRKGSLLLDFIVLNLTNNRAPSNYYSGNQTASINNGGGFYDQNRLFALSRQNPLSFYLGLRYQY